MQFDEFFSVVRERLGSDKSDDSSKKKTDIPAGLLFKCPRCRNVTFIEEFTRNGKVCPNCNYHSRLTARERLKITADDGSFREFDRKMISKNPIDFPGYEAKQKELREKTGLNDAVLTGRAKINGEDVVLIVMDSNFMMASMGSVVGERITRAIEYMKAHMEEDLSHSIRTGNYYYTIISTLNCTIQILHKGRIIQSAYRNPHIK